MIRIHNIKIPLDYSQKTLILAAAKKSGAAPGMISSCEIVKKSVDARKKNDVSFVVSLDIQFKFADNCGSGDVMNFYKDGDCAPFGRFNYIYKV